MDRSNERFSQPVTDNELSSVVQEAKPENTKRAEIWACKIWTEWSSNTFVSLETP